jgi:adenylate kinase
MTYDTIPQHNVYIFFGLVGAGKGTQAELLENYFTSLDQSILHLSPGAEFRTLIESGSFFGNKAKEVLDQGLLMPNVITNALTTQYFIDHYDGNQHVFFDGYPRTPEQAQALLQLKEFFGWNKPIIVFLNISEKEAIKRLMARGRHDDTKEGIRQRFNVYKEDVMPAIEQLKESGDFDFIEVDGERTVEEIHENIKQKLGL